MANSILNHLSDAQCCRDVPSRKLDVCRLSLCLENPSRNLEGRYS